MSIKKNTFWNLLGSASPMIVGLAAIPMLLENLGTEKVGVLTLIWALIGYFSIFDFGLGRILTYKISIFRKQKDGYKIISSIKSGLILTSGFGLFGAISIIISVYFYGIQWLNISQSIHEETYNAIIIAALAIPLATLTSGLRGILEGYEDFKTSNILKIGLGLTNFLSPIFTIIFIKPDLSYIVASLALSRLLILLLHIVPIYKKLPKKYNIFTSKRENLNELISFGTWMTLSNIVSPLMVMADRFVISNFQTGAIVAYYTIPFDFLFRLLILPASLTTTLFPIFSKDLATKEKDAVRLFHKSQIAILSIMFPTCLLISIFSYWGLDLWLGSNFAENSYLIVVIIAIGIFFNSMAQLPHMLIQASGDIKKTAIVHLFEFITYTPLLIFAVDNYGIVGAAWAFTTRTFVDFLILYSIALRKLTIHPKGKQFEI